ncbi:hypothetical protein LTR64_004011 [Lithohypha guttulata]|uniref:uncharacterized protein n=1 Tax=Lithohypha guttulata TaxID=1690604 RepID=UPI002DE0E886|nr:hypothetical protein LTR51_006694 [Lithohypha guttulata]
MPENEEHDDIVEKEVASRSWSRTILDAGIWFVKDQWFLLGMVLVVIISSQVQVPQAQQATKQVLVSYLSVSIIFFTSGCTLDTKTLFDNYAKWKHHLFVQAQCFLLVSALAFAIVSLTALNKNFMDPWLLIGLIFNGCQPTAMASNVLFTRKSHGNVHLTVVETTIGNLIGPFITPVLIKMYLSGGQWYAGVIPQQTGGYQALYRRVFMQFGLSIYLPMFLGQVLRYFCPKLVNKVFVDWKIGKFASCAMLSLLWQTFDHAFGTQAFEAVKSSNLIFIVFITIVNYGTWLAISFVTSIPWLNREDTIAVAMCAPAKTLALGVPISFLLFTGISALEEAKIQIPMLIFQVLQMGLASLTTIGFRRWVDAGERRKAQTQVQDEEFSVHRQEVDARAVKEAA